MLSDQESELEFEHKQNRLFALITAGLNEDRINYIEKAEAYIRVIRLQIVEKDDLEKETLDWVTKTNLVKFIMNILEVSL